MRFLFFIVAALAACPAVADQVCIGGRCLLPSRTVRVQSDSPVTVVTTTPRSVSVVSAQGHAEALAASGSFRHATSYGGGAEGIGMSSVSASDAVRRCCYWGQRQPRDIGTAWCPIRRAWIAVVRYH